MDTDAKLAADEARRIAQHESVKGEVREKAQVESTGWELERGKAVARQSAGFKQFIDALAAPFLAPFRGLLEPGIGRFRFMTSYIVALAVYLLLHLAVNGLLRMFVHRKTAV